MKARRRRGEKTTYATLCEAEAESDTKGIEIEGESERRRRLRKAKKARVRLRFERTRPSEAIEMRITRKVPGRVKSRVW